MRFQTASFLASLVVLAACGSNAAKLPAGFEGQHPTQPGSGPNGAHNPTGLFGLVQDEVVYRMYCNRDHPLRGDYVRHYACFETNTLLKKSLSAPNPEHLTGYINNDGTNFVLFADQIVTLSESLEIHVEKPDRAEFEPNKTCSQVKIYALPEWKLKFDKQFCPGDNKPLQLTPNVA